MESGSRRPTTPRFRDLTIRHFPAGFTILNADGGWFDPAAQAFIKEESRQILICTDEQPALRRWCPELAEALQQDELLVVEVGAAVTFRVNTHRSGHVPACRSLAPPAALRPLKP